MINLDELEICFRDEDEVLTLIKNLRLAMGALEEIAKHQITSVDKVYLLQQCEGYQAAARGPLAIIKSEISFEKGD